MRGLEPPAFGTTIRRSNQLSYIRHVSRVVGPSPMLATRTPNLPSLENPGLIRQALSPTALSGRKSRPTRNSGLGSPTPAGRLSVRL